MFHGKDIIIIIETKFNVRCKCPDGFSLVARSKINNSWSKARGGVAVFKKDDSNMNISTLLVDFVDCVIFEIDNTDIIIIAIYIPPSNSRYFDDMCFENIKLFLDRFKNRSYYFVDDLNSRLGEWISVKRHQYKSNPDKIINQNGRRLKQIICNFSDIVLTNGLIWDNKKFDSRFTFYRGGVSSQVDLCLTDDITVINELEIKDKLPHSDHCPCFITLNPVYSSNLDFINDCCCNFLNYNHYDINKRLNPSLKLEKCNLINLVNDLEKLAHDLNIIGDIPTNQNSINEMCLKITDGIRNECAQNKKEAKIEILPIHTHCSSANFKAIAHANFIQCIRLQDMNDINSRHYQNEWLRYHQTALETEEEELSEKTNKEWKYVEKNDPKKLWSRIDWKGNIQNEQPISPSIIDRFFKDIFQSALTIKDPVITDLQNKIYEYDKFSEITDSEISINEVELAVRKKRKGCSFDSIAPDIFSIAPPALLNEIRRLMNGIFNCAYPDRWNTQMLLTFPKKGHSVKDPKLRGVAIRPMMSRIFDTILDNMFQQWYQPNAEQAGFRKKQGCIIQIFSLLLIIDIAKQRKEGLYIGLIDYEKAFDFMNRYLLMKELIGKGIGSRYLTNIYNIYKQTNYLIKTSNSTLGSEIATRVGVTQGKSSSANLFSLFISDMYESIQDANTSDFMDPYNLLQLADDTCILADNLVSFKKKMEKTFEYSKRKLLRINKKKSKFICMSDEYDADTITITEDTNIGTIDPNEGYNWLGLWLTPTLDISKIIEFNLNKKMSNIAKFYAWLEINIDTPIILKIRVLYSCLFATIIYGCEAWGPNRKYADELKKIETKTRKSCLGVKQGTSNDIIYQELNQPDIVATIKERQFNFYKKYSNLQEHECTSKAIWKLYETLVKHDSPGNIRKYYENLKDKCSNDDITERRNRIMNSQSTMAKTYATKTNLVYSQLLYKAFNNERSRIILTRWRLYSHKLSVETGRYAVPTIPRERRLCIICFEIEDEHHALFICKAHLFIRRKYEDIINRYKSTASILNPLTEGDVNSIANYIREIERNMVSLKMIRNC